jgi:hypothetical protein
MQNIKWINMRNTKKKFVIQSKLSLKKLFALFGIGCLFAHSFILFYTFMLAFLNNGIITINIKASGEMYFELFFIPITLVWGIWSIIILIRKVD